jgi:hypothetical protein
MEQQWKKHYGLKTTIVQKTLSWVTMCCGSLKGVKSTHASSRGVGLGVTMYYITSQQYCIINQCG